MSIRSTLFALGALVLLANARSIQTIRSTTDKCANLANQPLTVVYPPIGPVTIGLINVCLCLSGISGFESTNIVAIAAIDIAGTPATTTSLTNLINGHGIECTYPDNATGRCLSSNACSFTCINGFDLSADGTACVCELPKAVGVNGLCAIQSTMRKRSLSVAESGCRNVEMACGVPGQPDVWECVDTTRALDSCGGCMFSPPAELILPSKDRYGEDCTEIPNVMSVECRNSACIVSRCHEPYHVSEDHLACVDANFVANHYE
ncbi:hypothetical protein CALVIDRAFT_94071 [Calocera viscosa TUFC12733]|uniref:Protein CPL1-like domain-containing protein n=1 Tax=Calocera viscosa (strain TUFC12733) TaxID=1330018 RepID=A0A167MWZ9_CALVF|nr:hypothetical protein CALVIDRAFT_94071 [Calocera viscosa TUFC12733]